MEKERDILKFMPVGVAVGVLALLFSNIWAEYQGSEKVKLSGGMIGGDVVLCGSGKLGEVRKAAAMYKLKDRNLNLTAEYFRVDRRGMVVEIGDAEEDGNSDEKGRFCFTY